MAQEMSISDRVRCSLCSELYELGAYCVHEAQELPWLVVAKEVTSAQEALANAVCQLCHGYKPGISVKTAIESFGVKTTAARRLLTREEIGRIVAKRNERQEIGQRSSPGSGVRAQIGVSKPQGGRVEIGTNSSAQSAKPARTQLGGDADERAERVEIRPRLLQVVAQVISPACSSSDQDRQRSQSRGTSLGADLLARLVIAHESGNTREFDRLHALAVQAKLCHSLTMDAINALVRAERKAEKTAREKPFKTAMAQAKRFLTLARKNLGVCDVSDHVERVEDQLEKASLSDLEKRKLSELMELAGTSERELDDLSASFYLDKTAVPDQEGSIALVVPRVGRVHERASKLPRPNHPLVETLDAGHMPELQPKIVYPEGEKYGNSPCIQFPDDRYRFEDSVDKGGELEPFMGCGQCVRMEYVPGYGWGYQPYTEDRERLHTEFRFGNFRRGYVTIDQIVDETLAVIVVDVVAMSDDGQIMVKQLAFGSIRMRSGRVHVFEIEYDTSLEEAEPVLITKADNTKLAIQRLPGKIEYWSTLPEFRPPKQKRPTMTQCVVLPDIPYQHQ